MTNAQALALLKEAELVFDADDEMEHWQQTLNMNDVWGWATSWCEYIPDEELTTVGRLFVAYGWCGVLYWMSERHERMRSEFEDVNRMVEFVRQEERIRIEEPNSSKRAYLKRSYMIGAT